jgi:aminotransferase
MTAAYTRRRERMVEIAEAAGFGCWPPEGAYYLMTDIRGFGYPDDISFARYLVEKRGVAVVPGSSFYPAGASEGRQIVRFAFPKGEATFAEAEQRLIGLRDLTTEAQRTRRGRDKG